MPSQSYPFLLRLVEMNLPAIDLLDTTLHFLHTGIFLFPASGADPDSIFGLLANAQFLMCEELTGTCLAILEQHVMAGTHEPYTTHAGFSPELVLAEFIARVLSKGETPASRRLEVGLQWLTGFEGLPDGLTTLRPLTDELVVALVPDDVKQLAERYPEAFDALVRPGPLVPMMLSLIRTQTCTRCTVKVGDEVACPADTGLFGGDGSGNRPMQQDPGQAHTLGLDLSTLYAISSDRAWVEERARVCTLCRPGTTAPSYL